MKNISKKQKETLKDEIMKDPKILNDTIKEIIDAFVFSDISSIPLITKFSNILTKNLNKNDCFVWSGSLYNSREFNLYSFSDKGIYLWQNNKEKGYAEFSTGIIPFEFLRENPKTLISIFIYGNNKDGLEFSGSYSNIGAAIIGEIIRENKELLSYDEMLFLELTYTNIPFEFNGEVK